MVTLRFILKSGQDIFVKCSNYRVNKTAGGGIDSYELEGIVENYPEYIDVGEISAIVRGLSDEPACVVLRGLDEAAPAVS